jgi:hypothetical protein
LSPRHSASPAPNRCSRGADCWHLATALYLSPDPSALTFLTLDLAQRHVAKALGFQT